MLGKFESTFMNDIVSYIDSSYPTIADKAHRAIAGLSMGGLHTIFISANNPDAFDYIGLFSAQTTNLINDSNIEGCEKHRETMEETQGQLHRSWAVVASTAE